MRHAIIAQITHSGGHMIKRYLIPFILCVVLLAGCSTNTDQSKEAETLDVLVIGGYGRDCVYYLESLAGLAGYDLNAAYLNMEGGSLRDQAKILATDSATCTYAESNGTDFSETTQTKPSEIIDSHWDIIIVQQAVLFAGFPGTYDSDLGYVTDYLKDHTNAKIYWNMAWAADDGITDEQLKIFYGYYESDNVVMFNAINSCLNSAILTSYAYENWIPTGAAVQTLRDQFGNAAALTANGHNLSFDIGRLTASLTLLKTLYSDFDLSLVSADSVSSFLNVSKTDAALTYADNAAHTYTDQDIRTVVTAVETACSLTSAPEQIPTDGIPLSENAEITIEQSTAPLKVFFPDLAILTDGSIIMAAYENVVHYPTKGAKNMQEGVGRAVIWNSTDNGTTWNYADPLLVIDEAQMEMWGIAQTTNRYASIASGNIEYTVMADPRDPNLTAAKADMDGDGTQEEVLLLTFWVRYYTESSQNFKGFLLHSTDGGKTWSDPQELLQANGKPVMKRGNIAYFGDGKIFIPYYYDSDTGGLLMEYDPSQGKWILIKDQIIPNYDLFEGKKFNEISLVVPNTDTDEVFAYCRDNGTVLYSANRGDKWEYIANEEGLIHQPGFAILDKEHVYVTWSRSTSPRTVYGKVFNTAGKWEDTTAEIIYESPNTDPHDMGDPSCVLLADGRVLVVAYDTTYRSIVGVYVEPEY